MPLEVVAPDADLPRDSGLRHNILSPLETLSQSISAIAPTTSPALTIPAVFALAGNGAWLAYALACTATLLMAFCIARFARTLSTMFAAGVPLVEALESVAGATGNIVFEDAVMRMRDEVATGQRLQRAMETTGLFPNMVIQMIAVGEESGSLDSMSAKVAQFYEAEVDNAVDSMSSLLEPLIMAILGVLVGGLVIAMYLPIFKLGAVV